MPKLYSASKLIKGFARLGFIKISQRGSHIKMRGIVRGELRTTIIPNHKQIAQGTLSSILKQANLSRQEMEDVI